MADEVSLALAFAEAIARPGGSALLIDEDNRPTEWVPVSAAVTSGMAFAVEPCDHVVAIDVDDDQDRAWAEAVRLGLEPAGCRFVIVGSGRDGHQHWWVLTPPGWNYEHLKSRMRAVAGEPQRWSQVRRNATRPPYAPHRHGGRAEIVEPGPGTALKWFRSHRPQGVPDRARAALMLLDPPAPVSKRGVVDRGRSIHKAALCLVNARCTQEDLVQLLRSQRTEVTAKYLDLSGDRREDFVEQAWRAACTYVRKNPPKAASRESLDALRESVPAMVWSPRTGATDRKVYLVLLDLGTAAATLVVNASVRQLAERACMSTTGARSALRRLVEHGYVALVEEPNRLHHNARSYRLLTDVAAKTVARTHTLPIHGGPKTRCIEEARFLDDIFTNGAGLGLAARETWEALPTQPTKTAEVAALRPGQAKPSTVLAHLKRLRDAGFAGRRGHRWWRIDPPVEDLDRLAHLLGVRGKGRRRSEAFARQRRDYLDRFYPDRSSDPAA